jgi:hypothetical protein
MRVSGARFAMDRREYLVINAPRRHRVERVPGSSARPSSRRLDRHRRHPRPAFRAGQPVLRADVRLAAPAACTASQAAWSGPATRTTPRSAPRSARRWPAASRSRSSGSRAAATAAPSCAACRQGHRPQPPGQGRHDLDRRGRHRAARRRTRAGGRARRGRGGQPRQERLPGQHQPRDCARRCTACSAWPTGARAGHRRRARRQYLDQISESAQTLTGIISDILDLSKIEAGKLQIEATLRPPSCCARCTAPT